MRPLRQLYAERIFPRVLDVIMDTEATRAARARVCAGLRGDVVEVGFGTGLSLGHLPPAVTSVRAVDPSPGVARRAADRVAGSPVPVELHQAGGEALPFADASADDVLVTWSLCTIPDPVAAVREIVRVLRPGGRLHFVEHGRSPDVRRQRWQQRLDPVQRRIGCGCSIVRDVPAVLRSGGMAIERLDTYDLAGDPKVLAHTFEGTALPV